MPEYHISVYESKVESTVLSIKHTVFIFGIVSKLLNIDFKIWGRKAKITVRIVF